MTRWKMVPVEPTPEMLTALYLDSDEHGFARADYALMLAAAPAWEPSDEDVERGCRAVCELSMSDPDHPRSAAPHAPYWTVHIDIVRAALKAAIGGG